MNFYVPPWSQSGWTQESNFNLTPVSHLFLLWHFVAKNSCRLVFYMITEGIHPELYVFIVFFIFLTGHLTVYRKCHYSGFLFLCTYSASARQRWPWRPYSLFLWPLLLPLRLSIWPGAPGGEKQLSGAAVGGSVVRRKEPRHWLFAGN